MQVLNQYSSPRFGCSSRLTKTVSTSSLDTQTGYSSASSISSSQSLEEECWRNVARWVVKLRKRMNVSKSTIYLTISYLWRLVSMGCCINQGNYERIAAAVFLLSAKMNEIYPPKIKFLISRCSKPVLKDELILTEAWILTNFDFDMSFAEITYSTLAQILSKQTEDKLEDCQKLLGLAVTEKVIMKSGEEDVALGIAYLIKPALVRDFGSEKLEKIKGIASKVYNLYLLNKASRS